MAIKAEVIGDMPGENQWTLHSVIHYSYLRRGGYVIVVVCLFVLSVCLVCLLATLRKHF